MPHHTSRPRAGAALLILFVVSGFAGLIYQSIWSHYLGLTLGHAAYAQTLVLAIFMGGMALGAWIAAKYSTRWRHLVLAYAVIEVLIGVCGLAFHPVFVGYMGFSESTVLPALSSAGAAHAYQWISAAVLIFPQCVMLGATFPLLSAGYLRMEPDEGGRILGGLYFSNSIGAAVGALVATFVLLPAVGMPGAVMTAGILNVLVGIGAWAVWRSGASAMHATTLSLGEHRSDDITSADARRLGRVLVVATFLSGAFSFVYEIGWIRMLNLALGTTVHSFELMLAAFIVGLAFGGLWIRRVGFRIKDAVAYAGYAQIWMGIAALLSVVVFTQSFAWVGWLMQALARNDEGYVLFSAGSAAIALLVMFPAAFFAGMTLPLFTMALLRARLGERSIGRIYAFNTLGAIVGVVLAMHVLIPLIGVRLGVTLAAFGDAALGLYLLRAVSPARATRGYAAAAVITLLVTAFSVYAGRPDPLAEASGVFRTGLARLDGRTVVYSRDGKTSTVAVSAGLETKGIYSNGKPDAAMSEFHTVPTDDELTMVMLGALPLVLHPAPKDVALIGWGSGLSTHTVLGSPVPESVDTIEIEPAMYEGARMFGARVERGYSDPRSHVRFDDARTFFATGARRYDVIVSEPSNPWVSGVASLFTREFYTFLHSHLKQNGVLVQWLHGYELDDALVATMLGALIEIFPNSEIYFANDGDFVIVGYAGEVATPDDDAWKQPILKRELERVGIGSLAELQAQRIGSAALLRTLVRVDGATPHSDFFPTVSLQAPRARFKNERGMRLLDVLYSGMPVLDVLQCRLPFLSPQHRAPGERSDMAVRSLKAQDFVAGLSAGQISADVSDHLTEIAGSIETVLGLSRNLDQAVLKVWSENLAKVATSTIGILPPDALKGAFIDPTWFAVDGDTPPIVIDILAAYRAASLREPITMKKNARAVLDSSDRSLSPRLYEQMLVLAMLGSIGQGDNADVAALEDTYGMAIGSGILGPVREYLLAWADQDPTPCKIQ